MLDKIALYTYTNSNCSDIWSMYFGQLDEHLKTEDGCIEDYVCSDIAVPQRQGRTFLYDTKAPYYEQYLSGLKEITQPFVIYSQEDFVVYAPIQHQTIVSYAQFLSETPYDYIRLIRCGFQTELYRSVSPNLFAVDMTGLDAFSMQVTLWKRHRLIELYEETRSEKWYESKQWNDTALKLGIRGLFCFHQEPIRGRYHHDSSVFPYTCTAISKGKWNFHLYGDTLIKLGQKYSTDFSQRGIVR